MLTRDTFRKAFFDHAGDEGFGRDPIPPLSVVVQNTRSGTLHPTETATNDKSRMDSTLELMTIFVTMSLCLNPLPQIKI